MSVSKELQETINVLFPNDEEKRRKLLDLDAKTIQQLGLRSQIGITPEDVIDACESNDSKTMEYLYKKAKKLVELQKLYKALCIEYSKANRSGNEER